MLHPITNIVISLALSYYATLYLQAQKLLHNEQAFVVGGTIMIISMLAITILQVIYRAIPHKRVRH